MADQESARTITGVVISDRMQKTITVQIERRVRHPKFGKFLRRYSTFKCHDEKRQAKVGDRVLIVASRPLSRTKRWTLVKVVARAQADAPVPALQA